MTDTRPLSEDDLIARYFAPLAGAGGLGLRDDAALLALPAGHELVLTKDAVVAGVHFFPEDPWDAVARKALRVNLSDLAAKGAKPLGYLLALALPENVREEQIAALSQGLLQDGQAFGIDLLGGDTVRTPGHLMLSITALGTVPTGQMLPRTGAQPGDVLCVTGTIGDAALGLQMRLHPQWPVWATLTPDQRAHLADRYLHPQPRMGVVQAARAHLRAGMDVSDGCLGDVAKLLHASGVTGAVELSAVPLSAAARAVVEARPDLLETALTGGDDYELILSVSPDFSQQLIDHAQTFGVPCSPIGRVVSGEGPVRLMQHHEKVRPLSRMSFSHF